MPWEPGWRRPWTGVFPKETADKIAERIQFEPDYDLAESLSIAIWRFRRHREEWLTPERLLQARIGELERALNTRSIDSQDIAIEVALWELGNPSKARGMCEKGKVFQAAREALERIDEERKPGRRKDEALWTLGRQLGAIYENGTGRKPNITGSGRERRGRAFQFAKRVCEVAGIPLTATILSAMAYRRSGRGEPRRGS